MTKKIAILGDFNPVYSTHQALNNSTRHIRPLLTEEIQFDWIATDIFNPQIIFGEQNYKGLWIAPGSPYKDMQNVLDAITYARQNYIPTLGNCAGFQHMLIEFARNVCGITGAGHEETNPESQDLLITRLSCSLVEQEEELTITDINSILFSIVKKKRLLGKYFCNYGLNNTYAGTLKSHGLKFTAISPDNQFRAFELDKHPFFIGTLFQPALTSSTDAPNPILVEFITKSLAFADGTQV